MRYTQADYNAYTLGAMPISSRSPRRSAKYSSTPKYQQLSQMLRRQVKTGRLKPGDRLPSFAEMRDQYGVSQTTIERVFNSLEQDGLIIREHGRGTFVAEKRETPSTGIIAIAGIERDEWQHSLYWTHMMEGISAAASRAKMQTLLLDPGIEFTDWNTVDGVLICGQIEGLTSPIDEHIPQISLLCENPNSRSVVTDDYGAIRQVVEHLLKLGHRRIAYLICVDPFSRRRVSAYQDALRAAGIEPNSDWVRKLTWPFDEQTMFVGQGRDRIREWLDDNWKELGCTALIALNDHIAIGAIESFQEAGYRVPQDVSVVGFDDTEIATYFSPRLTTVEVPLRQLGATGIELLVRLINGEDIPKETVTLKTVFHARASTGHAP